MNDELGTAAMIEALRNADKCTDTMKLGELGDFAAHAVQATPTAVPSTATIAALSKCQAP